MNKNNNQLLRLAVALYRRRFFLIIYTILACILSISISLSVKKTYVSSATILTPSSSGFSSFLPPSMTEGLGGAIGALTSSPGSGLNTLVSILNSRELAEQVIEQFKLTDYLKAPTLEDAIEGYRGMVSITINDESMIKVSVYAETDIFHPKDNEIEAQKMAFEMAKYVVHKLDSINVSLQTEKARYQRQIIERRYLQNREDLKAAETALMQFSNEFGVISLPEQFAASIQTAAELESQIMISKSELATMIKLYGDNSNDIQFKEIEIEQLNNALKRFLNTSYNEDSLSVLPAFSDGPNLIFKYTSLYREQRVQELVFEFLTQSYEQSKLEEAKITPTLQYIDYPKYPTRKAAPSRAMLAILITLFSLAIITAYLIFTELFIQDFRSFYYSIKDYESK